MARTAHRTLIIFAAFALASWALVAGAPVLAATPAEQAGPSLPPAEYKPLPVGTQVKYDTWGYTVTKAEGFDITFKTTARNWKHYYAVFGKSGASIYTNRASGELGSWSNVPPNVNPNRGWKPWGSRRCESRSPVSWCGP